MITHILPVHVLQRLHPRLRLIYIRCLLFELHLRRIVLFLQISYLTLKCRIFDRNEPKLLLENRRRAMFIDKFLQKIKHLRVNPPTDSD